MPLLLLIVLVAITGLSASGAQAAIVTVGPPLEKAIPLKSASAGSPILYANTSLPTGLNATSPVTGKVIAWRLNQTAGGPFRLRVLRPGGGENVYTTLGVSEPVSPLMPSLQTFSTSIPIQAGDTIGLELVEPEDDEIGFLAYTGEPAAAFTSWNPAPPDGVPTKGELPDTEEAFSFNADVQPAPAITGVAPAAGNIRGGTTVTLSGSDLNGASSVRFGEKFATSFSVESEGRITAVTPGASVPGPVGITVTTPGGTVISNSPNFTYDACAVPKLKGKKLKRVRKRLRASNCKLGKVKRLGNADSKSGRVVGQRPPPGKFKPPGYGVRVKLK